MRPPGQRLPLPNVFEMHVLGRQQIGLGRRIRSLRPNPRSKMALTVDELQGVWVCGGEVLSRMGAFWLWLLVLSRMGAFWLLAFDQQPHAEHVARAPR